MQHTINSYTVIIIDNQGNSHNAGSYLDSFNAVLTARQMLRLPSIQEVVIRKGEVKND